MTRKTLLTGITLAAALLVTRGPSAQVVREAETPSFVSAGGTRIQMLLDASNLGGTEVELAEITFPAGANSLGHAHGSTEIFYVLEGTLEHIVNGESHMLSPGMVGFVRPPDEVEHKVGPDGPVRALVIWAPGGEAARITGSWTRGAVR